MLVIFCYTSVIMGTEAEYNRAQGELAKLDHLHQRATSVLFTCRTIFPFDLFPNTLVIDYNKVDIIYRNFFSTSQTVSIPIIHLNYVGVDEAFFLATLRIETLGLEQNPKPLIFLGAKDAQFAKNLLFGLMTAASNGIDLSHLPKGEILTKLAEIGKSV